MIYIVVLNWCGWLDTIECLQSILKLNFSNYRIVICDNNSQDESVKKITDWINHLPAKLTVLKTEHQSRVVSEKNNYHYFEFNKNNAMLPDPNYLFTVIQTGENRGYGPGNNIGIEFSLRDSKAQGVWILNNDVVVHPDSLSNLYAYHLKHRDIGIIGSKLLFFTKPDYLQAVGGKFNKYLAVSKHVGEHERDYGQYDNEQITFAIDYPVGAALFVTKEFVSSVGLLSEDYFLYFEEIDWVTRGTRLGWDFAYCWQSRVFHKEGGSTGANANPRLKSYLSDKHSLINRVVFTKKFYKQYLWLVKFGLLMAGLNRLLRGQTDRIKIIFQALRL